MFAYTYNHWGELTNSNYFDYTNLNVTNSSNYDESFNYDKRGNLLTLTRNNEVGTQIDNLTYTYFGNSNQLARVTDLGTTAGFNKGSISNGTNGYAYSTNGNLTQDLYKGITSTQQITYNYLDLPVEIKSANGRITMLYDATGTLLCRTTFNSSNVQIEKRDYIGNFEYLNGVIDEVCHSQGRYKSVSGTWRHEFEIADHLGNARVIYTDASTTTNPSISIVQEMNYYAYGMQLPGNWVAGDYRYKYNED